MSRVASATLVLVFLLSACGERDAATGADPNGTRTTTTVASSVWPHVDGYEITAYVGDGRCVNVVGPELPDDDDGACLPVHSPPDVVAFFGSSVDRNRFVYVYSIPDSWEVTRMVLNGTEALDLVSDQHTVTAVLPRLTRDDEVIIDLASAEGEEAQCSQIGADLDCGPLD